MSSSGHLVLFGTWLGAAEEGILFEVAMHAATLLAVLVFYRRRVAGLLAGAVRGESGAWTYGAKLAVATVPAVVAVLLAQDFFESLYEGVAPVGVAFLATAGAVYTTRWTLPGATHEEPGFGQALVIGLAQTVAIVPGVSRSGATVAVALALGIRPVAAAEFSFLMSVVAIAGAVVLQIPELAGVSAEAWSAIAVGGTVALLSGLGALWLFVRLLRGQAFHRFAWYVGPLGAAVLAWSWLA